MQSTVLHLLASILDTAKGHADALRVAADHLAYLHEELEDMRAPAYDIPTAIQILQTGRLCYAWRSAQYYPALHCRCEPSCSHSTCSSACSNAQAYILSLITGTAGSALSLVTGLAGSALSVHAPQQRCQL